MPFGDSSRSGTNEQVDNKTSQNDDEGEEEVDLLGLSEIDLGSPRGTDTKQNENALF